MRIDVLYILLILLVANPSFAGEADRIKYFQLIISEQHRNLHAFKNHLGCPNTTIGSYLGLLLANGTSGDIRKISFDCKVDVKKLSVNPQSTLAKTHRFCRIRAYTSDRKGASPWQYDLLFLVNNKTHKLNSNNIYCPGAP